MYPKPSFREAYRLHYTITVTYIYGRVPSYRGNRETRRKRGQARRSHINGVGYMIPLLFVLSENGS
jgi:hypothetical protein